MYRKTNGGSETRLLRLTLVYYLVSRDERNSGKIRRDLEHGIICKALESVNQEWIYSSLVV